MVQNGKFLRSSISDVDEDANEDEDVDVDVEDGEDIGLAEISRLLAEFDKSKKGFRVHACGNLSYGPEKDGVDPRVEILTRSNKELEMQCNEMHQTIELQYNIIQSLQRSAESLKVNDTKAFKATEQATEAITRLTKERNESQVRAVNLQITVNRLEGRKESDKKKRDDLLKRFNEMTLKCVGVSKKLKIAEISLDSLKKNVGDVALEKAREKIESLKIDLKESQFARDSLAKLEDRIRAAEDAKKGAEKHADFYREKFNEMRNGGHTSEKFLTSRVKFLEDCLTMERVSLEEQNVARVTAEERLQGAREALEVLDDRFVEQRNTAEDERIMRVKSDDRLQAAEMRLVSEEQKTMDALFNLKISEEASMKSRALYDLVKNQLEKMTKRYQSFRNLVVLFCRALKNGDYITLLGTADEASNLLRICAC